MFLADCRNQKDKCREIILEPKPRKNIILLPGIDCVDFKLAINNGSITPNTVCTLVERNPDIFGKIVQWCEHSYPHSLGNIHAFNCPLSEVSIAEPIDFAYIDLCGLLNLPEALWIKNTLSSHIAPGADLAFTFTATIRKSIFFKNCLETVTAEYQHLNAWRQAERISPLVLTYIILFKHIFFPNHKFDIVLYEYRDIISRYHMVVIHLRNLIPKTEETIDTPLDRLIAPQTIFLNQSTEGTFLMATKKNATDTKTKTGTKTSTKTKTAPKYTESKKSNTKKLNASSIAADFASASTPAQRRAARNRLNALKTQRESEGVSGTQVEAGVKSWVTRLTQKNAKK